ncbi:MAG TPA: metalloregulator ArsR/SmtB family transcription factor [Pontiellaceae bacterium]|nr:metalloregulator ArsR/SmtB family transcription factor [Pontiellaceae bacterium]
MNKPLSALKSLSDRNRLRVVASLMHHDELCACQIIELLKVTGATASRHMDLLIRAGLVQSRKAGRWVHYRLAADFPAPLRQWLETELNADGTRKADRRALEKIIAGKPGGRDE